jgi:hypothetical protein
VLIISNAFIRIVWRLHVTTGVALPCMVLAMACACAWRQRHDIDQSHEFMHCMAT